MRGDAMAVIALVVALTVGALIAAFIIPIGVDSMVDDSSATFNQTEGDTVEVTATLNATLDDVKDSDGSINVTLNDTDTTGTTSLTGIAEDSNKTATIDGETITVKNDGQTTNTQATITYEYPPDFGWSDGAQALWGIIDVIIILAVFLMFIGVALGATGRV